MLKRPGKDDADEDRRDGAPGCCSVQPVVGTRGKYTAVMPVLSLALWSCRFRSRVAPASRCRGGCSVARGVPRWLLRGICMGACLVQCHSKDGALSFSTMMSVCNWLETRD